MNFKERGITVGDLLLILVFITSIALIINKVKDRERKTQININPHEITIVKSY